MIRFHKFGRSILALTATIAVVGGVTYAVLQSQQVALTGNSIQSATAGLLIGTTSPTSTAFSASRLGFTFQNIIPGNGPGPNDGYLFYLKNSGTTPLNIRVALKNIPNTTTDIDLNKVNAIITRLDTNTSQTFSLKTLADSYSAGGLGLENALAPATSGTSYRLAVSMLASAFTGASATVDAIDFVFSGTAVITE